MPTLRMTLLKSQKGWEMRVFIFALLLVLSAQASAKEFAVGYNQAWFSWRYNDWLTSGFDENYINKSLDDMKSYGGNVVRVWLFQGQQGIILNQYAPQSQGVDPKLITNLETVLKMARAKSIKIYLTLHDGNGMPTKSSPQKDYYYNLLNNKYGENTAFNNNVLAPLLQSLVPYQDVIYGLDLMNEIQAPISNNYWGWSSGSWDSPRAWMKMNLDFVKSQTPWMRVTSSAGWSWGAKDVKNGLFSGLGLDFLDIHVYDNNGSIPFLYEICERARREGLPVILGEFGQGSKHYDDDLQKSSTEKFLRNAKNSCLEGALAWRFDAQESYFAFQRADGSMRPAAEVIRDF